MKTGVAGVSGLAALVLLLPMEAGVPTPLPADLVMFTVGERVAAGQFPLWLAVTCFEVIAAISRVFPAPTTAGAAVCCRRSPRQGASARGENDDVKATLYTTHTTSKCLR